MAHGNFQALAVVLVLLVNVLAILIYTRQRKAKTKRVQRKQLQRALALSTQAQAHGGRLNSSHDQPTQPPALQPPAWPACAANVTYSGNWTLSPNKSKPYEPSDQFQRLCDSRAGPGVTRGWHWDWSPSSCHLPLFEPSLFCKALGGRSITFVGDSLTFQQFVSLVYLLGAEGAGVGEDVQFHTPYKVKVCKSLEAGFAATTQFLPQGYPADVTFIRNDRLLLARHKPWNHFVQFHKALRQRRNIVVLNTGAHYVSDSELRRNLAPVLSTIKKVQAQHAQLPKSGATAFVWRNPVPGHDNCRSAQQPFVHTPSKWGSRKPFNKYSWDKFLHQGRIVQQAIRDSGVQIWNLDVFTPTSLRGDWHPSSADSRIHPPVLDCLHYCLPGPPDEYNRLLYPILLAI
eukprot:gene1413-431_t